MKTQLLKVTGLAGALFFASLASGQTKPNPASKFVNPFAKKANFRSAGVIMPTGQSNKKNVSDEYSIEKRGDYSLVRFSDKSTVNKDNFFQKFKNDFEISEQDAFNLLKTENDEIGFKHYRYQQTYNGISIIGGEYLLHEKGGELVSANGNIYNALSINTSPNISRENAIQFAIKYIGAEKYLWENPKEEQFLKSEKNNPNATYFPKAELVIAPVDGDYEKKDFRLCYKINVASQKPYDIVDVFIDAHTGKTINKIGKIAHADVTGTGSTLYSGTKNITMDSYSGSYRLRETGRPIQTFNMNNSTDYADAVDFTNSTTTWSGVSQLNSFTISAIAQVWWYTALADEAPDLYIIIKDGLNQTVYTSGYYNNTSPPVIFNNLNIPMINPPYSVEIWDYDAAGGDDFGGGYTISQNVGTQPWTGSGNSGSYINSSQGRAEVDVHWAMEKTYDFYLNQLSRNSFDNAGSIIKNYVHFNYGYDNAFWNGVGMTYGDGSGNPFTPLVSIDVVGHEFSHAVVEYTANLQYQSESGALNESFADIFGTAIEFYGATSPNWDMGEPITVSPYSNLRSLSDPNNSNGLSHQPDTYNGSYWENTSDLTNDHGGVHTNSGVQNFWFYLLSQGGSGVNDIGNAYNVTAIGINQATQIAYRNLRLYLTSTSNYMDAYWGSLQAAEDLYGNPSAQYTAVKEAWYAVGIGNDPSNYCSGTTNLTASSGTITDGSGSANYNNNANCKWIIAPPGATQISLTFTTFDTEANYDTVFVYDGPDDTYPVLSIWWGNTLPSVITTSMGVGAMCVKFTSDLNTTAGGWSANYTTVGNAPSCDGITVLSTPGGSFSDGSGANTYGNNQQCLWAIAPPCATSVTLSFSQFNTEQGYDGVVIYDDLEATNQLAVYTGTTIPSTVTSTTGVMLVIFVSDYAATLQGFSASYISTGASYCSSTTNVNTVDWGLLNDGSGTNNYCNNSDCSWLIQPPQATTVTLNFTSFDLEEASSDGLSVYDAVEVYDGTTTSAPLLGKFTGSNLPPSITSTGGSMLIRFYSDIADTRQGWEAYYTSTQNSYCTSSTTLTAPSGTFNDGSGATEYANNSYCTWLIQPPNAASISLSFSSFDTELNYDGVIVYDGANNTAAVLGQYTGNSVPPVTTSTGNSMYVEFLSDPSERGNGWVANYTANITTGLSDIAIDKMLTIFPNPTTGVFTVNSSLENTLSLQVTDMLGKQVLKTTTIQKGNNQIDASGLNKGIYLIRVKTDKGLYTQKLTVN